MMFQSRDFYYENSVLQKRTTEKEAIKCGYEGISVSKEDIDITGLGSANCHPWNSVEQFYISGAASSKAYRFYSLRIYNCRFVADDPETECEPQKTILESIPYVRIDAYNMNRFVDLNEFVQTPVKTVLENYSLRLLPDKVQTIFF